MSCSQPVFRILILFIYFSCSVLAQRTTCSLPNNKEGQCIKLDQCEPYWNAFTNNLIDSVARQYLKTNGLCRFDGSTAIVCCERDAPKCITPENKPGACVQLRRCDPLLKYLETQSFDDKTINYLRQSECEHPGKQARICCPVFPHPITGVVTKPKPLTQQVTQTTTSPPKGPPIRFPLPGEEEGFCGVPSSGIRIIGGDKAGIYEYPWAALLKYGNGEYNCGGSLIHPRYVLTAAHCVVGPRVAEIGNIKSVRLGETDLTQDSECDEPGDCNSPPVDIEVEEVVSHPTFSLTELYDDIALLRLKTPAPYTEFIRPICLQPSNIPTNPVNLTVVGWGRTENQIRSDVKLFVKVPLYDDNKCREKYMASKNTASQYNIGPGQFCAGGELDKDSCQGDSGGPLMFTVQQAPLGAIFYQTGIVSFGPRLCGITGTPGVYTKVTHYIKWIRDNTYE